MNITKLTDQNFNQIVDIAVEQIQNGKVIIAPFDTVYGFITDSKNEAALELIFKLKNRDKNQTIGLAADSISTLEKVAKLNHLEFIKAHIPGPYTFILPALDNVEISPNCIQKSNVAIRIPDSKLIQAIVSAVGFPLAQTSANISGQPACHTLEEIKTQFPEADLNKIGLIIDGGAITSAGASQIYDLTGPEPTEIAR